MDRPQVIKLDSSSPWGCERKHVALHEAGHYKDAINAFEEMHSKMSQSSPKIHGEDVDILFSFIY